MIAVERRASTVLFNLLSARRDRRAYLIPVNACPILALTLRKARVPFELIDISGATLCIDPGEVLERVARRPRYYAGLIYVRTYGALADTEEFFREFKRHAPDAWVVDDRCLCPPLFTDRPAGRADIVLYSTGYAKYVDIGWGGYGVLADGITYKRTAGHFDPADLERLTANYKRSIARGTRFASAHGDWLDQRRLPLSRRRYAMRVNRELEQARSHKQTLTAIYRAGISLELQFPESFQSWRFNLRVGNSIEVVDAITSAGLFASRHYAPLNRAFAQAGAPNAEALHRHVVNLFNDRYFDTRQAHRIVDIVSKVAVPVANQVRRQR